MYADFFGLRELPFNNTPDPRFFYSTPDHEEALASLIYAVRERKGFVLLTGEVGAGKTLVSRMMLRHFGMRIVFANIHHAVQDASDLMESVCSEFELPHDDKATNAHLVRILQDYLLRQFSQNTPVVLVLDEAQNLTTDAFEQLRMIGNLEADDAKLLQIVIVGQPELQRIFKSQQLRQLRQRVYRAFHLPALSREAIDGYIRHRLAIAGAAENDVFDDSAIDAVCQTSKGLPRLINTICDNAMLSAYSADRRVIDGTAIRSVVEQMLMIGGVGERDLPHDAALFTAAPNPRMSALEHGSIGPGAVAAPRPESPHADVMAGSLARRVDDLEASLAGLRDQADRTTPPSGRAAEGAVTRSNQALVSFDRRVHQLIAKAEQRVAELGRECRGIPALVAQARRIGTTLRPLVSEARSVADRTQVVCQDIKKEEMRAREMAPKLQTLVRQIGRILEGVRSAAARAQSGRQSAERVLRQLGAQTRRSGRLVEVMNSLSDGMLARGSVEKMAPIVVKEASVPIGVLAGAPPPGTGQEAVEDELLESLSSARRSLRDLRTLARESPAAPTSVAEPPAKPPEPRQPPAPPTHRLEREVEGLLEMVGAASRGIEAPA